VLLRFKSPFRQGFLSCIYLSPALFSVSSALSHYLLKSGQCFRPKAFYFPSRMALVLSGFWATLHSAFSCPLSAHLPGIVFLASQFWETNWSEMQISHKQSTHNKLKQVINVCVPKTEKNSGQTETANSFNGKWGWWKMGSWQIQRVS